MNFRLPAPTTDNWLVAMVYGSKSLAPVLYPYPGGGTLATPFAFTNPILIDADGNGYDRPPFMRVRSRVQNPQPMPVLPPKERSPEELLRGWGEAFGAHSCGPSSIASSMVCPAYPAPFRMDQASATRRCRWS